MSEGYVHGIVVVSGTKEVRIIRTPNQSAIGAVGTAPHSKSSVKDEVPVAFFSKEEALGAIYESGEPKGTLYDSLTGIYEQGNPTVVVVKAKSESTADIESAIEKLLDAESVTGIKPKVLVAGGHTGTVAIDPDTPLAILADPIVKKLAQTARRLNGIGVVDGPADGTKVKDYRDINGDEGIYIVYPKVKIAEGQGYRDVPASSYVAGLLGTINYWESPSNREIQGIVGTSVPISFALDDPQSLGQRLNAMQVSTIVRAMGFRLWGVRGTGDQTDLTSNQLQKLRIRYAVKEALIISHQWAIAKGLTATYFETVAASVNSYFAYLMGLGAIAGGECVPNKIKNTPEALFDGRAYFTYRFTPTPVSETLTFEEEVTSDFLTQVATAANAA
jgi:phage tail sheath protein FI